MFKLFLNVVIVVLIFFVEVAYVNCIKRIYDDDDDDDASLHPRNADWNAVMFNARFRSFCDYVQFVSESVQR